ncbi:Endonuclease/exonuclease/phosphatase [Scheffersomyces coipomensis]|uniref:Endonuclease/exonuclease/phosphatase n=1 Tax=Scheffersomyces coipomensis TaxID=1788519 RepID=UPI00315D00C6
MGNLVTILDQPNMTRRSGAKRKKLVIIASIVGLVILLTVLFTTSNQRLSLKQFGVPHDSIIYSEDAGQDYEENINGSGSGNGSGSKFQSTDEIEDLENEAKEHNRGDVKEDLRKWKQQKMDQELQKGSTSGSKSGSTTGKSGSGSGNSAGKSGTGSVAGADTGSSTTNKNGRKKPLPISDEVPSIEQQKDVPKTKKLKPFQKGSNKIEEEEDEYPISKNPNGFLGDIDELDPDEKEIVGDIYDKSSTSADRQIVEIPEGIPPPGQKFDKVSIDVVEYPSGSIPSDFYRIKIKPFNFRIYSHNIKNGADKKLNPGEEIWATRFRMIAASIKFNCQFNCVVALQEAYKFQLNDILKELNRYEEPNTWSYYGVGRIDGKVLGEHVPIIYKTTEFELIYGDSFWLNEVNPRVSTVGWDSAYPKIASYVTLKHKDSENYINVFNTHYDSNGDVAKIQASKLIMEKMDTINEWPSFLVGDLNAESNHKAYKFIIQSYNDVAKLATPFNTYGHERSSVTGFEGEVLLNGGRNIDYIFAPSYTTKVDDKPVCDTIEPNTASNKISLRLQSWGMLHSKFNGKYMSNHRPLVAEFSMGGKC